MWQGEEPLRPQAPVTDFIRTHPRELLPRHSGWQLDAHTFLQRFSVFHRDALGRVIAQVVALLEHRLMFAFNGWLGRQVVGHPGRERLVDCDRHVAGQPAWPLVVALGPLQVRVLAAHLGLLLGVGVDERQNQAHQQQNDPNPVACYHGVSSLGMCLLRPVGAYLPTALALGRPSAVAARSDTRRDPRLTNRRTIAVKNSYEFWKGEP